MLKKILIVIGFLAVLGIGGMLFLENKIENKIAAKEPEFRQYVTMTTEEQNAYVEKNLKEFLDALVNFDEKNERAKNIIEQVKADPEALQAGIATGRSMVAGWILANENILKDLSADIHNQLKAEADEAETRTKKFSAYMEKYFPENK